MQFTTHTGVELFLPLPPSAKLAYVRLENQIAIALAMLRTERPHIYADLGVKEVDVHKYLLYFLTRAFLWACGPVESPAFLRDYVPPKMSSPAAWAHVVYFAYHFLDDVLADVHRQSQVWAREAFEHNGNRFLPHIFP